MENCENCDVDDQPNPDEECDICAERALAEGRITGMSPETFQMLEARSLIKAGYRFDPEDLAYWQWKALVAVDAEMDKYHAEKLKSKSKL